MFERANVCHWSKLVMLLYLRHPWESGISRLNPGLSFVHGNRPDPELVGRRSTAYVRLKRWEVITIYNLDWFCIHPGHSITPLESVLRTVHVFVIFRKD